ncbi:hypothetical protein Tco_1402906 [Tanacetum coccineum]
MVCPPNENELDFRISLDKSEDEDYTVIFDENSFSYKIISVIDLKKTNSGNDKPLSPNPTVDYFDDLDYFKDLENEFPAIVYNDILTSKLDLGIKPLISSECIDELNLINETSLSEYDKEIISCFNDLFNDIHLDNFKLEKDDDDNDIELRYGTTTSSESEGTQGLICRLRSILRRLGRSYCRVSRLYGSRAVNQLGGVRRRMTWRQFILALGLRTKQEIAKARFGAYWAGSDRLIPNKGDLRDYWIEISSDRDFLGPAPSYVLIRDPVRRLCHMMISYSISGLGQAPEKVTRVDLFYLCNMDRRTANVPHLLAQYLFRHAERRKSEARILGGHFIRRLAMHFGLVSDEGLRGLQVVTQELPLIDLHELGRIHICTRYGDT